MAQQPTMKEMIQKTSIVLGYDKVSYGTTSKDALRYENSSTLNDKDMERFAKLKKDLTSTHFDLGDTPTTYETSNILPDPTGNMHKYTAKLDVHAKGMLRSTSAVLGYDSPQYETSTASGTKWDKQKMIESIQERNQTKKFADPTKVNYNLGSEPTPYLSTSKEAYTFDAKDVVPATMADEVKKDLRKCHYTLGNDTLNYSTSNHIEAVPVDVMKKAKGDPNASTNPWKTSISLTHE